MRILWLSHFLPFPLRGHGSLQRSSNLLRFIKSHCELTLLTLDKMVIPGNIEAYKRALSEEFKRVEFFSDNPDLAPIKRTLALLSPIFTSVPYSTRIYNSNKITARARKLLMSEPFDILHLDTLGPGEELLLEKHCPTILCHHNIESAMMSRRATKVSNPFARFYLQKEADRLTALERTLSPLADLNLVVSESDKETLEKIAPTALITVLPNSVDIEFFSNNSNFDERSNILFVGGLNWYPNKDAVTFFTNEIWPLVRQKSGELVLTCVGVETDSLSAPKSGVCGAGAVPDVREYFSGHRVFICPMRDGGGTRTKLLDAMAAGIPIVSTTIGAEGLNIVPGEHMLVADDPRTFADYILELYSNRNLWKKFSEAGKDFVRANYSVDVVGRKLLNAYESVISSNR